MADEIYDRPLTPDTKWIVCMWDIKGDSPWETATILKRSLKQINDILDECMENGYYDKVRRHIEYFNMSSAKYPLPSIKKLLDCERNEEK